MSKVRAVSPEARPVHQRRDMRHELETLLIRKRLLTWDQTRRARQVTMGTGSATWLEHLILEGAVDESRVADCVARAFCLPVCELRRLQQVTAEAVDCVPAHLAAEHRVAPVAIDEEGYLRVAMLDPLSPLALDELRFFSGRPLLREVGRASYVAYALKRYYGVAVPRRRAAAVAPQAYAAVTP